MKKEVINCWEKDKDSEQVMYILRETFASRCMEMKNYVGRPMYKLCVNYPMLKDAKYVSGTLSNICTVPVYVTNTALNLWSQTRRTASRKRYL